MRKKDEHSSYREEEQEFFLVRKRKNRKLIKGVQLSKRNFFDLERRNKNGQRNKEDSRKTEYESHRYMRKSSGIRVSQRKHQPRA